MKQHKTHHIRHNPTVRKEAPRGGIKLTRTFGGRFNAGNSQQSYEESAGHEVTETAEQEDQEVKSGQS